MVRTIVAVTVMSILLPLLPQASSTPSVGIITFTMQGNPGDWVIASAPVTGADCRFYHDEFRVTASSTHEFGLLVRRVGPTYPARQNLTGFPTLILGQPNSTVSFNETFDEFGHASNCTGFGFAIASDGSWNASVTITLDANGPTGQPSFVSTGTGTTTGRTNRDLTPLVQTVSADALLSPGWTHVQYYAERPPAPGSISAHRETTSFPPPGDSRGNWIAGYYGVQGYCSCGLLFESGFFGSMTGVEAHDAGVVHLGMTSAELVTTGLQGAYVHLPLTAALFPSGLNPARYYGSSY